MGGSTWLGVIAAVALNGVAWHSANGATLSFSFTDPVGDSTAVSGDLTGMNFVFDNTTGAFTISFTADAAAPFNGHFRINVNLFNPDTGTTNEDPAFFQDDLNDFNLGTPTTTIELTGTNTRLTSWSAGNRVAANQFPFGNPAGGITEFVTALVDLPSWIGCTSGADCLGPPDASNWVTIVPEPSVVVLLSGGFLGFALAVRTRRRS